MQPFHKNFTLINTFSSYIRCKHSLFLLYYQQSVKHTHFWEHFYLLKNIFLVFFSIQMKFLLDTINTVNIFQLLLHIYSALFHCYHMQPTSNETATTLTSTSIMHFYNSLTHTSTSVSHTGSFQDTGWKQYVNKIRFLLASAHKLCWALQHWFLFRDPELLSNLPCYCHLLFSKSESKTFTLPH